MRVIEKIEKNCQAWQYFCHSLTISFFPCMHLSAEILTMLSVFQSDLFSIFLNYLVQFLTCHGKMSYLASPDLMCKPSTF